MYRIEFTPNALKEVLYLRKTEQEAYEKAQKFIDELRVHPRTGTGKPERLKHYKKETWSRRITRKHRLVYEIKENIVTVKVISAYGHYDDK
ncbi:Toxin RelK [bioreactor metagenome]|uniref:Putative mRNA interferase YoeB n=1 Tax=bioreactor metagenome TaxID=1076179 RepID=A0A645J333_9ZZZZ|nr:Txe/YoeB family addiction module toxin [Petrimonas sp.]